MQSHPTRLDQPICRCEAVRHCLQCLQALPTVASGICGALLLPTIWCSTGSHWAAVLSCGHCMHGDCSGAIACKNSLRNKHTCGMHSCCQCYRCFTCTMAAMPPTVKPTVKAGHYTHAQCHSSISKFKLVAVLPVVPVLCSYPCNCPDDKADRGACACTTCTRARIRIITPLHFNLCKLCSSCHMSLLINSYT